MCLAIWKKLIHFGFRLLYNELAWTYDVVSWSVSLGAWRKWQLAALPFVRPGRVLELGHGPGHILSALEQAGFNVVGVDLSPFMGRLARRRSSASLARGRAQALPFRSAAFESVISTFPTEYILDPMTIQEVHRVLAPGSRFIIVPEGHLTGTGPLYRVIEWLYRVTGQRQGIFASSELRPGSEEASWALYIQELGVTGFQVKVERIALVGSMVTVVVACKTSPRDEWPPSVPADTA